MASKPTVYFGSVRTISTKPEHSFVGKYDAIIDELGIKKAVKDKNVVIKMHLGSNVGFSTVNPFLVGRLVGAIKEAGGRPYVVDIIDQYPDAWKRGYTPEVIGCPILPVAGPADRYYVEKEVDYKGLKTLKMGGHVKDAEVLIDLSHVKGHNSIGYGAAIKNLAIGCFTQDTRWAMHQTMQYDKYWDKGKSRDAEKLAKACPFKAISYKNGNLKVEFDTCNQCMRCVMADADGCLQIKAENFLSFVEINAIAAKFVLSHFEEGKRFFINVATDITEYCDCWGMTTGQILPDLGVLGSRDVVAVDKASLDLLAKMPLLKENVSQNLEVNDDQSLHPFARIHGPYKDPYNVIRFAEKYGLGSSRYELEEVLPPVPEPKRPEPRFPKIAKTFQN
ncbi:MAG: DUF362 domain-containing protein [Candidatus Brockarchaeota archaeon]|nr:DUF362 domain-containing protein [Candidatus Brockarchaeota archaeon]